ncbi:hypothetical protein M758_6G056200 [Ceratodon purpureus]|uniref:Uncharacterized protein n=1 Tax=Ceratodon purpureus TaxID=3225 RepID=A0A8T0HC31_CERPU|nr:hypothetical protein KC19_6G060000 [Ceratodon purpureus]KAG0612840.1 hypothetical protein M758_6G056200 [Ceratodon purpureus]
MSEEDEEDEEEEEIEREFTWSGAMEDYLPVGPGFATYNNGDEYWGSYYDGKRNSYGRYTFMKTGANYEGNYTDNLKSGFGIFTYPDRSVYTGTWYQDMRSGEGQYTYANGDIYKGQWSENKKHGVGTYFFKETGSQFIGDWEQGFFVKGKWVFRSGDFYEGPFVKSKPEGPGKYMFFKSKSTVTGTFEKTKWTLGSTKPTPAKEILEEAMKHTPFLIPLPPPDVKSLPSYVVPMKFK